jgi:hypothetical protein
MFLFMQCVLFKVGFFSSNFSGHFKGFAGGGKLQYHGDRSYIPA